LQTGELDGYATAFLNGGKLLAVNTALANLIRLKAMHLNESKKTLISLVPRPTFAHELEQLVYDAAGSTDGTPIADVRKAAKPCIQRLAEDLQAKGLVVADKAARRAIALPLIIALVIVAVGVVKIWIGVERGKPVGILAFMCIMSALAAVVAFARRPLRSRYGDAVLKKLQEQYVGPKTLGGSAATLPPLEFALVMGLFGMGALAGSEFSDLRRLLQPPSGGVSGDGCGSSCGGGCGGGCGGCGGGCGGD
jgi:uncharacterized protein (TIGR04222 family)